MGLNEILSKVGTGYITAGILVLLSLIQISPLKINPWDRIFGWIGKKTNGNLDRELKELQKQVRGLWINNHRQTLLTFARECRNEISHSSDEWANALNVADEYETYCEKNGVTNGVVKADTEYIRNLYQELSRDHRI